MVSAAAISEAWRRDAGIPLAFRTGLPKPLRHLFLPEMRTWLVRAAHMADELKQVAHSHVDGAGKDTMVAGISGHHQCIRDVNPAWALDMLHQIPASAAGDGPRAEVMALAGGGAAAAEAEGGDAVGMAELRRLVHASNPWWL